MDKQYTDLPLYLEQRGIINRLSPKYGEGEAKAMCRIIFENLKGWKPVDLAIRVNEPISEFIHKKIDSVVERLLAGEPIQYIFGQADFYGIRLTVTPDVLIPRPETAELVDIIVKQTPQKDLRVVDFGTGSGCIAIALSRNLAFADVSAVDISSEALEVARKSATQCFCHVKFCQANILQLSSEVPHALDGKWDIIVSNPPYITSEEKSAMEDNVLMHEPASALFVPDNHPIIFYSAIIDFAKNHLQSKGHIYFELNPLFAKNVRDYAVEAGFTDVELLRDSFGKTRFAIIGK